MPLFYYKGRTSKTGELKEGDITAPDERSLAAQLRDQGILLTEVTLKNKEEKTGFSKFNINISGVSLIQKILFTRDLKIMLDAGISLSRAIGILATQTTNKDLSDALLDVQRGVEKGDTFSSMLAKYPKIFSPIFISMVSLGEKSGNLSSVLDQLAIQMKKDYDLMRKVKGAMYYPAVILVTMVVISIIIVGYVLPKLIEVLEEMGTTLPWTTRLFIGISKFLTTNWILTLAVIIALIVFVFILSKSHKGKKALSTFALKLPKISGLVKKVNLARFARALSSLLKSGIPIVNALKIVSDILGNKLYKEATLEASKEIKKGTSIVEVFKKHDKLFLPMVIQIMSVGEETGTLDEVLTKLAEFYEDEVDQEVTNISSIIEPILMLVLGAGVGILAVSVISPIYSLSSGIK